MNNTIPRNDSQVKTGSLAIDTIPENLHPLIKFLENTYSIDTATLTVAIDATFAIAAQASFDVQRPSDKRAIPISDFFIIAAPSGSKKDTVIGLLCKPILETQEKWIEDHQKANIESPKPIVMVNSATTEGIRNHITKGLPYLGLVTGEICTFIGGYSMKPEQKLATLGSMSRWWDGSTDTTVTALNGVMHTRNNPRVSVAIWGQPELVVDFMYDKQATHQGLLNRFLPHAAEPFKPSRLVRAEIDSDNNYVSFCNKIETLMSYIDPSKYTPNLSKKRKTVLADSQAEALWCSFYDYCQTTAFDDPDFQSYWVRLPEHCLRASARQSLMRLINNAYADEPITINEIDVQRSIQRVLEHAKTARRWIVDGDNQNTENDAEQLLTWLKTPQNSEKTTDFTESLVTNHFPTRRLRQDKKARNLALNFLCDRGKLKAVKIQSKTYYTLRSGPANQHYKWKLWV